MIQKKVCMLGCFAVGKTSLVQRFVNGIFSDKYQTTVGVKIDRKQVILDEREVNLMLWDLHGDDQFQRLRPTYLRGAAGYLLVVDRTRRETLARALEIRAQIEEVIGALPHVVVLNKMDLEAIHPVEADELAAAFAVVSESSAKTGAGVEEAFRDLTRRILTVEEART